MTNSRHPDRPTPDSMLIPLRDALDRSDSQFRQNNDVLNRRGTHVPYQPGYIDARFNTTNGTHSGRVFFVSAVEDILELHPTTVTNPDHSLATEVTYLRANTIEAMQVTFTFEGTFEVAITRNDINKILDHLHATATAYDGDSSAKTGAAMEETLNAFRNSGALTESLDLAERNWRTFQNRTLAGGQGSGVVRGGWYHPASRKGKDPHYGEIAFQHVFANMPTDYLYPGTRDRVCQTLAELVTR